MQPEKYYRGDCITGSPGTHALERSTMYTDITSRTHDRTPRDSRMACSLHSALGACRCGRHPTLRGSADSPCHAVRAPKLRTRRAEARAPPSIPGCQRVREDFQRRSERSFPMLLSSQSDLYSPARAHSIVACPQCSVGVLLTSQREYRL